MKPARFPIGAMIAPVLLLSPAVHADLVQGPVVVAGEDGDGEEDDRPADGEDRRQERPEAALTGHSLRQLDDRELKDIGICRHQIGDALTDIASELSKRYGIQIQVDGTLATYNFTFTLSDETLEETLSLISSMAPVDARQTGDTVTLSLKK